MALPHQKILTKLGLLDKETAKRISCSGGSHPLNSFLLYSIIYLLRMLFLPQSSKGAFEIFDGERGFSSLALPARAMAA